MKYLLVDDQHGRARVGHDVGVHINVAEALCQEGGNQCVEPQRAMSRGQLEPVAV
jgi:hypothetical protein